MEASQRLAAVNGGGGKLGPGTSLTHPSEVHFVVCKSQKEEHNQMGIPPKNTGSV